MITTVNRLFLVLCGVVVAATPVLAETLPPLPEGAFTYVVIPDTQLYHGEGSKVRDGETPQIGPTTNPAFESRIDWIVKNRERENIVISFFAILCGVGLGIGLHRLLITFTAIDTVMYIKF